MTPRPQSSPINTLLVHIPHPESVERYVNYKLSTAIKTVRLQPQLNLVHIPDTEYTQVPSIQLQSEISTTSSKNYHLSTIPSKFYPPLKPLRKSSTSLSNLLDNTSDCIPSQESKVHIFFHTIVTIPDTFLHVDLVQIRQHLIYLPFQAIRP